jgi:hypothetical protein
LARTFGAYFAAAFVSVVIAQGCTAQTNDETIAQPETTKKELTRIQAYSADAFVDSIGVGTHVTYTDTPYYTQWPKIFDALRTLGVRHIRDGFYEWQEGARFYAEHQYLASAGIHTTYVVPLNPSTAPETIERVASKVGDMEALEAPNECDVPGNCNGDGMSGVINMLGFLPTIHAAGEVLGIPVVGPSFTQPYSFITAGNISSELTYNNLHVYFGGRNPGSTGWGGFDSQGKSYGSFSFWLDQANIDAPGVPVQITETGYISYPTTNIPYTLPENVAAAYAPRTLLLAFHHGIKKTFLYELLDEVSSPGYGLLNSDLSAKPAFTALTNLISTLADPGPPFAAGHLPYAIAGGGSTLNQMLLEKRDGSFYLVLWLEASGFDPVTATATTVPCEKITLTLQSPAAKQVMHWDTSGNVKTTLAKMQGSSLTLNVSDQITIVKIVP